MPNTSWSERLRYRFDNFMARGTPAMVGGLGLISLGVIFVAAALLVGLGIRPGGEDHPLGFIEAAWQSLMRTLDSGTMGGDAGWGFRIVMLLVTLGGVFIISALIGVLSAGIDARIEALRQGRSRVVEAGHILVLGWSPKIFAVLNELATANANVRRPCVVILGAEDKVVMESEVRERGQTGRLRIVCRHGNPLDPNDLRIGSPETARSIIVLPAESVHGDIHTVKALLALAQIKGDHGKAWNVVAAVRDAANLDAARLASGAWAHIVLVDNLIARITAQTCRQSGLSIVTQELLDFDGDEIYFAPPGAAGAVTYGEALQNCVGGTGIGIRDAGGAIRLNPSGATAVGPGDRLIVIAADDDKVGFKDASADVVDPTVVATTKPTGVDAERTLVLGWNRRGDQLIAELDNYVTRGSTVHVVAQLDGRGMPAASGHTNLSLSVDPGNPCDRATLEMLDVPGYDHVIVLAGEGHDDHHVTDAQTLITLLHLRDIADRSGRDLSVVSEMLDVRNRDLAVATRADDFIVSDRLVSLLMVQIAENPELEAVFQDLFDPDGAEIYLKPASDYVVLGTPLTFHTVIESALRKGETAIGYRRATHAGDPMRAHGVVVNPVKSERLTFEAADRLIVLAET